MANWVLTGWNLHPVSDAWKQARPKWLLSSYRHPMKVLAGLEVPAKAIELAVEEHWRRNRPRDHAAGDRPRQTTGPAHCYPTNHPENVCADGWCPSPRGCGRNRGQDRPNRRANSPHRVQSSEPYSCRLSWIKQGWPIRDPDSTSYVGAVETADEFGYRVYTEAWRRGWEWATTKIVIGDGAVWIWNLADQHFPGAVQIVDLYHARQHLVGSGRTVLST